MYALYEKGIMDGSLTRETARELIAEQYLKYGASYFSFGGRNEKLEDATNELSWVALEAYDMPVSYTHLDVYKRQAGGCRRSTGKGFLPYGDGIQRNVDRKAFCNEFWKSSAVCACD